MRENRYLWLVVKRIYRIFECSFGLSHSNEYFSWQIFANRVCRVDRAGRLQTSVTSRILDRTASSKVPSALENSQLSSRNNPDAFRGPGMELWRSNEKSRLELFFERVKCTSAGDFVKNDLEMVEKYVPSFVMPNNSDNIQ